jgi:hypothetical protein
MKKIFLSFGLLFTLGLTGIVAQDYVGTYLGTLTVAADVYLIGDVDDIHTEILNQELQVSSDWLGFSPNIPLYKNGETAAIGLVDVVFEPNGNFSAPERSYEESGMTFTNISGTISGNTINLTFQVLDAGTGGTLLDATFNYTGTKQMSGINEVLSADEKRIVSYYSIVGQKLDKEPENGSYIVVYDNGTSRKVMKK